MGHPLNRVMARSFTLTRLTGCPGEVAQVFGHSGKSIGVEQTLFGGDDGGMHA